MIKVFAFLIISLISSLSVIAQDTRIEQDNVPLKIQAKFFGKYKDITDVSWKKTQEGQFKAHFYTKNREISVYYDKSGRMMQVENVSKKAVLTDEVSNHINERFPGNKILEFKKVTRFYVQGTTGPQHYFEILLKEGKKKSSVFFDGEMNLMQADNVFNLAVN